MYKIGDIVWIPYAGNKQVQIKCPICDGKLKVTLILGNGDECILPCSYCASGYEGPKGHITEYEYGIDATIFTVTGMNINSTENGEEVEYHSGTPNCYRTAKVVYPDRELALKAAEDLKREYEEDQVKRADYMKYDKKKSYSWNAGYHLRNANKMRRDIEYHEKMAVICKSKAKGD
jgi:hypothetical protein